MKSVRSSVDLPVAPELALEMFLNLTHMQNWWGVERGLVELKVGGCWTVAWQISDKGFGYVSTGIISEYEPVSKLKIDNMVYLNPEKPLLGPMTLEINVKPENGGTLLTVEQSGYREGEDWEWYYNAVVDGWPYALNLLKDYAEKLNLGKKI